MWSSRINATTPLLLYVKKSVIMKMYLTPNVYLIEIDAPLFCVSGDEEDNNKGTLPGPIEVDPWGA